MHANYWVPLRKTVGTSGVIVSESHPNKVVTILQADPGNTQRIYFGGLTTVTTLTGAPGLAADKAISLPGSAQITAVAGAAGQTLLVLEGFR